MITQIEPKISGKNYSENIKILLIYAKWFSFSGKAGRNKHSAYDIFPWSTFLFEDFFCLQNTTTKCTKFAQGFKVSKTFFSALQICFRIYLNT